MVIVHGHLEAHASAWKATVHGHLEAQDLPCMRILHDHLCVATRADVAQSPVARDNMREHGNGMRIVDFNA